MKGRPQDYMDVGIVHFMAFPEVMASDEPAVDTLKTLCDDDYFQVLEVKSIGDEKERKRAIELVKGAGKKIGFGAQPTLLKAGGNLNALDPETHQAALDLVRKCLDEAAEWGASALAVLSGKDPGEEKRNDATAMLIAALKDICEHARRAGDMPIILETFDRKPFGKNCLIGPTEEAANVADRVAAYYLSFGLAIDLSHLPLLEETPDHAIQTSRHVLRLAHIGNCVMKHEDHPAYGDEHPPFGIEEGENGVDELAAFLKALLDAGYIGEGKHNPVSMEVKPCGDLSSDDVIANGKATLDAAWAAL